jgi:2-oxoisovalerate dehydrogenase E1 component
LRPPSPREVASWCPRGEWRCDSGRPWGHLARQAAAELDPAGQRLRVVDLRWLSAIDHDAVRRAVAGCRRVLVVDECRRTGSVSKALLAGA